MVRAETRSGWSRAYERDYPDTGAALERYTPAELIGLARRLDPGLEGRDFAEAAQRLDQMSDSAFTAFGLTPRDITKLRGRIAAWPRDAGHADAEAGMYTHKGQPADGMPGEEPARASDATEADQSRVLRLASQAELDEPELEP